MPRLLLPLAILVASLAAAPARTAPESKPEDFVIVQKGTLPIIVSAPHGGRTKVPGVPERTNTKLANFATVLDANTDLVAEKFASAIEKQLKGKVWLVI